MDPISGLMLAGGVLKAGGSLLTGINQAQNLNQAAKTDQYNAQVAYQESQSQRAAGAAQEEQIRSGAERQLGAAFGAAAQSGTRGGTTAGAVHDVAVQGELDAQNAAYNADERARATYIQGQQAEYQGKVAKAQIPGTYFGAGLAATGALAAGAAGALRVSPTLD